MKIICIGICICIALVALIWFVVETRKQLKVYHEKKAQLDAEHEQAKAALEKEYAEKMQEIQRLRGSMQ